MGIEKRPGLVATMVRLPSELHEALTADAGTHFRSMNAEIVKRLQESFIGKPRVRVRALTEETRDK